MRAARAFLAVCCICIATHRFALAEDGPKVAPPETMQWRLPVCFDKSHEEDLKPRAETLAKALHIEVWNEKGAEKNPVCCFWLQIEPFSPNPGQAGYVIVIQRGGAFIVAADKEQMDAAIKRIDQVAAIKDGQVRLPIGLITNYCVVNPK